MEFFRSTHKRNSTDSEIVKMEVLCNLYVGDEFNIGIKHGYYASVVNAAQGTWQMLMQ